MELILQNRQLNICLSTTGAAIRSMDVTLPDQTVRSIALCFAKEEPWHRNSFYSGATLAPSSGRIKDGLLPVGTRTYTLSKNENGTTHLHGGFQNLSFRQWEIADHQPDQSVTFQAFLPDGTDGYPGNRRFFVTYRLGEDQLTISMRAETDQPTYINMTNHTYFNLNGFHGSGLDQYLKINGAQVIINDRLHLPKKAIDVSGTEFDFTGFQQISTKISQYERAEQIALSRGYNHCFLLSADGNQPRPSYSLMSSDRKLAIDFYTDAPALIFYSGGFLESSFLLSRNHGSTFYSYPGCAVALEPCVLPFYTDADEYGKPTITHREFQRELRLSVISPESQ